MKKICLLGPTHKQTDSEGNHSLIKKGSKQERDEVCWGCNRLIIMSRKRKPRVDSSRDDGAPPVSMERNDSCSSPDGIHDHRMILSGTLHLRYNMGEDISSDVSLLKRETEHLVPARRGGGARSGSTRSTVSLQDLVETGIIEPGKDVIECRYKKMTGVGSLGTSGVIEYDGQSFTSATAFSIYFKRKFAPKKLGDDGWKSVYYKGECLDVYRKKYLAR